MIDREDGKHMSFNELMECDIFALIDSEMRIYSKKKKENEIDPEAAFNML